MLYYSFLESIENLDEACNRLLLSSAPSPDEQLPENAEAFLFLLNSTQQSLKEMLQCLPKVLENYKDKRFGPNVSCEDTHKVLSAVFPLTMELGINCPARSYFPIRLLRAKSSFIIETINLYCDWREELLESQTSNRKMVSFLKSNERKDSSPCSSSADLETLFLRMDESVSQSRQQIKAQFKKPLSEL